MERLYWYKINLNIDFSSYANLLNISQFEKENEYGFSIDSTSRDRISGKFIQSKLATQEFINPFGDNEVVQRKVFEVINFNFINGPNVLLETRNPGRCVSSFFNELNKCFGYSLVVDTPQFELFSFIEDMKRQGFTIIKIQEIELSDISLSNDAIGTLIVKGSLSINDYVKKLPIANLKHRLKKFKAVVDFHGIRETIEVHSSNKIVTSDKLVKFITPIVENVLWKAVV